MTLLFDIGNTHTHIGLAGPRKVIRHADFPTAAWFDGRADRFLTRFSARQRLAGVALCSVVPQATALAYETIESRWSLTPFELTHANLRGLGIDYPRPETIGPDRLANAVAARAEFGAPVIVIDFGTAVTFDVVNARGDYVGGVITPGLSAMTDYLHEKTALLPRIRIREVRAVIGRNTEEAMLIGAVHGYRGLIRGLLLELRGELRPRRVPAVATGGYAALIAARLREIDAVRPALTLEGLRRVCQTGRQPTAGATE